MDPALIPVELEMPGSAGFCQDPALWVPPVIHNPADGPCPGMTEPVLPGGQKPVRFGIIGTGAIAEVHARAIQNSARAQLTWVFGGRPEKARDFAHRHGCQAAPSLEALLASEIDAVTIATPSGAHLEAVVAAAGAGKHILCEKPLEITSARIDQMLAACEKAGVKLSAVFQSRLSPAAHNLSEALRKGRFGDPVLVSASVRWYRSPAYFTESPWRGTWEMDGGGVLMNQAIHTLDLLLLFGGPVACVTAHTARRLHRGIAVEDTAVAVVKFHSGALGTIEASTACAPGRPRRLDISGTKGSATLESDRITHWQFSEAWPGDEWIAGGQFGPLLSQGGAGDPKAISTEGHQKQIDDLAKAIRTDQEVAVPGNEGRRAIALIEALYESAKTAKTIFLN